MGVICMSLFWSDELASRYDHIPAGLKVIRDPAYAWGELIKANRLPLGFTGVLVASEVAAYMSTLSALLNWGSSFLVNDFYKEINPGISKKKEIVISRLTTFLLFIIAAIIAIFFVDDMVSWFVFVNSVVVIFWLPLAYFRFFWPRFNVWGEMTASVLGIPLTVLFWFVLDFQSKPIWQGTGMLFAIALAVITLVTLLTPPESDETQRKFYLRCKPPAGWKKLRIKYPDLPSPDATLLSQIFNCLLGISACLGMTVATNAVFVKNWLIVIAGGLSLLVFGGILIRRTFKPGIQKVL